VKFLAVSQGWRGKCEGFRPLLQHSSKFQSGIGGRIKSQQFPLRARSELWGLGWGSRLPKGGLKWARDTNQSELEPSMWHTSQDRHAWHRRENCVPAADPH
jgi:hypothetical protein